MTTALRCDGACLVLSPSVAKNMLVMPLQSQSLSHPGHVLFSFPFSFAEDGERC